MKEIVLSGSPGEIGKKHGELAKEEVMFSLETYEKYFRDKVNITWKKAKEMANLHLKKIEKYNPNFVEEMVGLSKGAGVDFEDILTLNTRSEIALTQNTSDGCTSLATLQPLSTNTFLSQNWDWRPSQQKSLIAMKIVQKDRPDIYMVTEGGIIGKIGFNSSGIGVCLNAIRANVKSDGIPIHLGLRSILESTNMEEVVSKVSNKQMASAANFLVAHDNGKDDRKAINIEVSPIGEDFVSTTDGALYHTNHLCSAQLKNAIGNQNLFGTENSYSRLARMKEFITNIKDTNGTITQEKIEEWLADHDNYPNSICRHEEPDVPEHMQSKTAFSVIMNLSNCSMLLMEGNPCSAETTKELSLTRG